MLTANVSRHRTALDPELCFFFISFKLAITFRLLDKPWSQMSFLLPPGYGLSFLSRRGFVQYPHCSSGFIECANSRCRAFGDGRKPTKTTYQVCVLKYITRYSSSSAIVVNDVSLLPIQSQGRVYPKQKEERAKNNQKYSKSCVLLFFLEGCICFFWCLIVIFAINTRKYQYCSTCFALTSS